MRDSLLKVFAMCIPFGLCATEIEEEVPSVNSSICDEGQCFDQIGVCMGGTSLLLFKALKMTQDAGYSHMKILSYELLNGTEHVSYTSSEELLEGEKMEFVDEEDGTVARIYFAGLHKAVGSCVCVEDYQMLIDALEQVFDCCDED